MPKNAFHTGTLVVTLISRGVIAGAAGWIITLDGMIKKFRRA